MASADDELAKAQDETWTFTCERCGFTSNGWPTRKGAEDRRRQHLSEHRAYDPKER
jgi:hypothetical protein